MSSDKDVFHIKSANPLVHEHPATTCHSIRDFAKGQSEWINTNLGGNRRSESMDYFMSSCCRFISDAVDHLSLQLSGILPKSCEEIKELSRQTDD